MTESTLLSYSESEAYGFNTSSRAYNFCLKNPHFLPDFYWWGWISSLGFSELTLEFLMYLSLEFLMYLSLGF